MRKQSHDQQPQSGQPRDSATNKHVWAGRRRPKTQPATEADEPDENTTDEPNEEDDNERQ
jgi:hypothetical protein